MPERQKPLKPPHGRRNTEGFSPELNPSYANIPTEAEQPGAGERTAHILWEVAKTVGFIILAATIIRVFLVQPFFVEGESMEPSFLGGDYLLVNQMSYNLGDFRLGGWQPFRAFEPDRGDVIVFKAPPQPETNYIKRIIAMPGETVEIKNGNITVRNQDHQEGVGLKEPYIEKQGRTPKTETRDQTRWEVGPDQYFVVGDNRDPGKSEDSRSWGTLPKQNIIGKAWVRAYPLARLGFIRHEEFKNLAFGPLLAVRFLP